MGILGWGKECNDSTPRAYLAKLDIQLKLFRGRVGPQRVNPNSIQSEHPIEMAMAVSGRPSGSSSDPSVNLMRYPQLGQEVEPGSLCLLGRPSACSGWVGIV